MPPEARFVWACPVGTESQLAAVRAAACLPLASPPTAESLSAVAAPHIAAAAPAGEACLSASGMAECGINPSVLSAAAVTEVLAGRPLDGVRGRGNIRHRITPYQLPLTLGGVRGTTTVDKLVVARGLEGAAAYLQHQ
ncbi:hypothetical protein FOA52_005567 [Chlamydomonas sp. UWO 241]|nr:hypothetical protein FOA52_005567 [Chlamydomonas sp. UWO 241]